MAKRKYEITHTGRFVGLNQYKSLHWRNLAKIVDPLKIVFNEKIRKKQMPVLKTFNLTLRHNTRFDNDNIVGSIKVFVDCLRASGVIKDDTYKEWSSLHIIPDKTLPKRTVVFEISED